MSDKIMAAISKEFIERMRWWAQMREASVVQSAFPVEGPGAGVSGPRFHTTQVPLMLGIVHDTELAIAALPGRYRQAVRQFWMFEGVSLREHGRKRDIHRETFEIWVLKGHELLKEGFATSSARWRHQLQEARAHLSPELRAIADRIAIERRHPVEID